MVVVFVWRKWTLKLLTTCRFVGRFLNDLCVFLPKEGLKLLEGCSSGWFLVLICIKCIK